MDDFDCCYVEQRTPAWLPAQMRGAFAHTRGASGFIVEDLARMEKFYLDMPPCK